MSKTDWGTYQQIVGKLEIADIVEIDRYDYKHFVMYWGIHQNGRALCFHVYVDDDGNGKRHLQYLDDVVGQDRCRRNNLTKEAKSRGLTERSKQDQIKEASKGLSTVDITDCCYNVLSNNCETHVTDWKYTGGGFSKQGSWTWTITPGKTESDIISLNDSLMVARVEDEIRRQIGVKYGEDE